MKTKLAGNTLTVFAERKEDYLSLSVITRVAEEMAYIQFLADKRVSDAQRRMHKATEEVAAMKKGWCYSVLDIIHKMTFRPKGAQ